MGDRICGKTPSTEGENGRCWSWGKKNSLNWGMHCRSIVNGKKTRSVCRRQRKSNGHRENEISTGSARNDDIRISEILILLKEKSQNFWMCLSVRISGSMITAARSRIQSLWSIFTRKLGYEVPPLAEKGGGVMPSLNLRRSSDADTKERGCTPRRSRRGAVLMEEGACDWAEGPGGLMAGGKACRIWGGPQGGQGEWELQAGKTGGADRLFTWETNAGGLSGKPGGDE